MITSPTMAAIAATVVSSAATAGLLWWRWRPRAKAAPTRDPRLLAEHVVDMVSTHDAAGKFRYTSPVLAGLVGEYPGMLAGKDPKALAHPDDGAALDALWRRALASRGAGVSLVWRCRRHTGEYSWLETTARAASQEAQDMGAIICASRDITDRKQFEDALRDSEQRFRSALETVRLVALGLDTQGTITFTNDALCALTGWSRSELVGENWFDKCTPPGDTSRRVFLETVALGKAPEATESEVLSRDGTRRMIAWDTSVLRASTGEVQGTASLGADVTERRLEDATMKLLQSITQTISASPDLDAALALSLKSLCDATGWMYGEAWLLDVDEDRLKLATFYAAPSIKGDAIAEAGREHGFARGEGSAGRAWASGNIEWFHDLPKAPDSAPRLQLASKLGLRSAVAVPVRAGDRIVAVLVFFMSRPMHSDERHTRMVSVVASQVGGVIERRREQRRYEAELLSARDAAEGASKAKSEFLSRMSHELRTPLNSVIGFANVLKKNKNKRLAEEDLEFLNRISTNGRHLLALVNNVLDISKVEAGRLTVTRSMMFVDVMLEEIVAQLQGQPRAAGVDFRAEVPDEPMPLETDQVLMRQVLINLAGNALKFTHQGSVVVSAELDNEKRPVRLRVRDTGIGIPPDRLAAVFEPFEQAEDTTHSKYGGTGLGLSISKAICDALGYRLLVESTPGVGSTFTVELDGSNRHD